MPITSSAKKALRQSERRRTKNAAQRKALKNKLKAYEKSPTAEELQRVYQAIDKAAKRGILKKNTASRRKARFAKMIRSK